MILLDTHVLWWLDQKVASMGAQARTTADHALTADERLLLWPGPLRRADARP